MLVMVTYFMKEMERNPSTHELWDIEWARPILNWENHTSQTIKEEELQLNYGDLTPKVT